MLPSEDYLYTSRFVVKGHIVEPTEDDLKEAKASLDPLRGLLPANIDPQDSPDLLFVVANLAVGGVVNANDDGLSIEDALRTYKQFEWKLCDIEHDRKTIVGFILKAGLSELGTNRLITEDEARAANRPFNITTLTILWKVAARDLSTFIQESSAPGSPDKDSLSLSFEVGFNGYDVVVMPKGVSDLARAALIVSKDSSDFDHYDKFLRVNKGKGVLKTGERVARILAGKIVPLGEGIVTVPAAAVKGLLPILGAEEIDESSDTEAAHTYSSTHVSLPEEHACAFRQFAASIPNEHIYDEAGYGRDMEPHITALYGIKTAEADAVKACVAGYGTVTACLGEISAFIRDEKPYDVLKAEVDSPALHRLHHLIKASVDCDVQWPDYNPHVTVAYLKKGMAAQYIGNKRFAGLNMAFDKLVFSSHTGDKTNLSLTPETSDSVYSSAMNRIKLSQGWKERFASFKAKDPLVNAVTVTLSDGRVLNAVHIFDGDVLEFDKAVSVEGTVITDMTPGERVQIDNTKIVHPHAGDVYPTVRPEKQAENAARLAEVKEAQKAAYTDASASLINALNKLIDVNTTQTRVSSSISESHSPMNLDLTKLNQVKASLEKATKPEDFKEAAASAVVLADEIARASEEWTKTLKSEQDRFAAAEKAREAAVATQKQLEAQVGELKTSIAEMKAAQATVEAQAKFQAHMSALEETFELDDETRALLVDEVKACLDDETFAKWMDKSKVKMKEKTKAFKAKQAKADDDMDAAKKAKKAADDKKKKNDDDDDDDDDDAKAAQEAIASAQANRVDGDIHNGSETSESLVERMQKTFANGIKIDGVKVKKLIKQSTQQEEQS